MCEYSDKVNYQNLVNNYGKNKKGIIIPRNAYMKSIPHNGYYRYKTNPNMFEDWIISGEIKVVKILNDKEVNDILIKKGINPMPRYGGEINLKDFNLDIAN